MSYVSAGRQHIEAERPSFVAYKVLIPNLVPHFFHGRGNFQSEIVPLPHYRRPSEFSIVATGVSLDDLSKIVERSLNSVLWVIGILGLDDSDPNVQEGGLLVKETNNVRKAYDRSKIGRGDRIEDRYKTYLHITICVEQWHVMNPYYTHSVVGYFHVKER